MSWITYDYICDFCDWEGDILQKRSEENHDKQFCPVCNHTTTRQLSAPSLLSGEIKEKCKGGEVRNGKVIRQYTGHREVAEQNRLEKLVRRRKDRDKDKRGAAEVMVELMAKRKEGKKKL